MEGQSTHFPLRHRLRVRWTEVDAQQVVFNGHYLTYLDVAISEYWRAVGLPYPDAFVQLGGDIFVRQHQLAYHAPARLDDWLDVGLRCERIGNSSIAIAWEVRCDHRLLVSGQATYVYIDLSTGRPHKVPDVVREQVQAQAEGRAVTTLQLGPWQQLQTQASSVRRTVFIDEQGVPEHEEWDADDAHALHAVVRNLAGLPLATGRLITQGEPEGQGRIGRMAVIRSARGSGVGAQVLQALVQAAAEKGCQRLTLHAQCAAMAFYARAGFVPEGAMFDEVGIPHQTMIKAL
jgi:YbgC/YbaW family acyl-CoA thioester hydrolase